MTTIRIRGRWRDARSECAPWSPDRSLLPRTAHRRRSEPGHRVVRLLSHGRERAKTRSAPKIDRLGDPRRASKASIRRSPSSQRSRTVAQRGRDDRRQPLQPQASVRLEPRQVSAARRPRPLAQRFAPANGEDRDRSASNPHHGAQASPAGRAVVGLHSAWASDDRSSSVSLGKRSRPRAKAMPAARNAGSSSAKSARLRTSTAMSLASVASAAWIRDTTVAASSVSSRQRSSVTAGSGPDSRTATAGLNATAPRPGSSRAERTCGKVRFTHSTRPQCERKLYASVNGSSATPPM